MHFYAYFAVLSYKFIFGRKDYITNKINLQSCAVIPLILHFHCCFFICQSDMIDSKSW